MRNRKMPALLLAVMLLLTGCAPKDAGLAVLTGLDKKELAQGGLPCRSYYEGETLRDYCYRNGEPYPVREIPEEVIKMFESGDFSEIKKWRKEVPELKKVTRLH